MSRSGSDHVGDRDLQDRAQSREDGYYDRYRAERNATSIDGLPAID